MLQVTTRLPSTPGASASPKVRPRKLRRWALGLLTSTLALASCAQTPGTSGIEASRITGQIEDYRLGHGSLQLTATTAQGQEFFYAIGNVQPDGTFQADLVSPIAGAWLFGVQEAFCSGLNQSEPTVKVFLAVGLNLVQGSGTVAGIARTNSPQRIFLGDPQPGDALVVRIYADADTTITGSCRSNNRERYQLDLRRGWNVAVIRYQAAGSLGTERILETAPAPYNTQWYAFSNVTF